MLNGRSQWKARALRAMLWGFWDEEENALEHRGSDEPKQKGAQDSKPEIKVGVDIEMFVGREGLEVEWAPTNGMHFVCEMEIRFLRVKKSICPASRSSWDSLLLTRRCLHRLKSLAKGIKVCSTLTPIPAPNQPQPTPEDPSEKQSPQATSWLLTGLWFNFNPSHINNSQSKQLSLYFSTHWPQCTVFARIQNLWSETLSIFGSGPFLFSLCSLLSLTSSGSLSLLLQSIQPLWS